MHTLNIKLDDSIYEHLKAFLKFYPQDKLSIIDDESDTHFSLENSQAYTAALTDMDNAETTNWKDYARTRNINV
ncbi:MAG: hypothetical protein Q8O31_00695 [Rhodocyclaceae bacterium]|nr:hypothetical protein [Rhodocyclaceae bacterium]